MKFTTSPLVSSRFHKCKFDRIKHLMRPKPNDVTIVASKCRCTLRNLTLGLGWKMGHWSKGQSVLSFVLDNSMNDRKVLREKKPINVYFELIYVTILHLSSRHECCFLVHSTKRTASFITYKVLYSWMTQIFPFFLINKGVRKKNTA